MFLVYLIYIADCCVVCLLLAVVLALDGAGHVMEVLLKCLCGCLLVRIVC